MAKTVVNAKPLVSAIIVNWNGAHHLRICLPSLRAQTSQPLEIVVVDNGSKDDSGEVAREFQARWLPLGQNVGLAPALNHGVDIAGGDFLLFINNDMRFDTGFVAALLKPMQENDAIFAADGMQFNWDGSRREHLAARLVKKQPGGLPALVPGLYFYPQDVDEETPVFMGSAASMLVRRSFFEKLSGFDDRLPLGYEDVEICWRAWLQDWKTVYVREAICWHHVGASGRSQEGERMNFCGVLRGRLLLATKLLPLRYIVGAWLVSIAALGKDLSRFRWAVARDRIKVLRETGDLVPQLLREREKLFGATRRSPEKHLDFLLGLGQTASKAVKR
jgi:GT2 family glycosyltransferase